MVLSFNPTQDALNKDTESNVFTMYTQYKIVS